jgi:hypothetical protein
MGYWPVATSAGGGRAMFGDGPDGDVTISSNTTVTVDSTYDNLTIDAGFTLTCAAVEAYLREILERNA